MFTTVAFHKAAESATLLALQPIADQHVTVRGDDLTVPELNQILAAAIAGVGVTRAQLQSPSLRVLFLEDIGLDMGSESFAGYPDLLADHKDAPIPLITSEKLNVYTIHTTDGWALIWLGDGPIAPLPGVIRTIRAVPDVHSVADVWTNSTLTFGQTLPAGRYQVAGMRAFGTNLLAARLVFVGYSWRPGVPAGLTNATVDYPVFRRGRFGAFGEFEFDQPPSVDLLGTGVSASEELYLDLIQVRAGRG